MSFDIHYHTCNLGTRTEQRKNPFTRAVQTVAIDNGLSATERANVLKLLQESGAVGPDEFGSYVLDLSDGGSAEVFAKELEGEGSFDGCMVAIRSLTPKLISLLWELCHAGNMVAMPVMENAVSVVSDEQQRRQIQARWPDAVVVPSPEDFGRLLRGGFDAWRSYRDQVTG